jgi:hypothetical protein
VNPVTLFDPVIRGIIKIFGAVAVFIDFPEEFLIAVSLNLMFFGQQHNTPPKAMNKAVSGCTERRHTGNRRPFVYVLISYRHRSCQDLRQQKAQYLFPAPFAVCQQIIPHQVILQIFGGNSAKALKETFQSAVIGIDPLDPVLFTSLLRHPAIGIHLDETVFIGQRKTEVGFFIVRT